MTGRRGLGVRACDACLASGGSATLSVTGGCRYGAVMEPSIVPGSRLVNTAHIRKITGLAKTQPLSRRTYSSCTVPRACRSSSAASLNRRCAVSSSVLARAWVRYVLALSRNSWASRSSIPQYKEARDSVGTVADTRFKLGHRLILIRPLGSKQDSTFCSKGVKVACYR